EERAAAPARVDRGAEAREARLEAGDRVGLDEAGDEDPLADARYLRRGLRPPRGLRLRREAERHRDLRLLDDAGQELAREPAAQLRERGPRAALGPGEHDARVAAVERELRRHAVGVAQRAAEVVVAGGREHVALLEGAAVRGEDLHLLRDPELLLVVTPLLDPDRGEEGAARHRVGDRTLRRIAQRLLASRRDPALDRERPGRGGAGRDEVV